MAKKRSNTGRLTGSNPMGRRHASGWLVLVLVVVVAAGWWVMHDRGWSVRMLGQVAHHMTDRWVVAGEVGLDAQGGAHAGHADKHAAKAPTLAHNGQPARSAVADGPKIKHWCHEMAERLASVSRQKCNADSFRPSGLQSVKGRLIPVADIRSRHAIGRVLLIGGIHGDELSAVSIVFWWLDMLKHGESPIDWRVAPSVNPDGLLHHPPKRVNAHGVDLNRNMPTPGWHKASREYWQNVGRNPRRFPGHTAGSQPETQWLLYQIRHYRPDVIVSIHAPLGIVDYDGKNAPPSHLGDLPYHYLGVYPGSLGNYAWNVQGIPVITVELKYAGTMPKRVQAQKMWQQLNTWLKQHLRHPLVAAAHAGKHHK